MQRQIDILLDAVQSEGEARSVVRRIRELEQIERKIKERLLHLGEPTTYSLEDIRQSLRQFASAWEYMTEPERHEVVSLGVRRVDVKRKDAYEIHLYVPDLSMEGMWLPSYSSSQISVKVVDLPREGIAVADISLGG